MSDLTKDARFTSLVAATETILLVFANAGVRDARLLTVRQAGWNTLPGEVRGLIPLSAWFIGRHPNHLNSLRTQTSLGAPMGRGSPEARNPSLWQPIQRDLKDYLATEGGDVVSLATQPVARVTAQDVASNYLSTRFCGGHTSRQAGDNILKRILKLLAHALP